jgi:hypothetical protein
MIDVLKLIMKDSEMEYACFSPMATPVNLQNVGVLNGYKITSVLHSGRRVSLAKNDYFYIPQKKLVVSYRGTKAKVMTRSPEGKYNFQEKLEPRGVVPFKVDCESLHRAAESCL